MLQLSFDQNGCLYSLCAGGTEFARPGTPGLFTLMLRDFIGNPIRLKTEDFQSCKVEKKSGTWELIFSGTMYFPQITVKVSVNCLNDESRWSIAVNLNRDELAVEWISFPELPLHRPEGSSFLLSYAEGTVISDLEKRQNETPYPCREAAYGLNGVSSFYPGPVAMQFEALLNNSGCGLYFGVEDKLQSPKTIDFMPDGSDGFYPFIQHFTGGADSPGYETVVKAFNGDWQDAAEIYRNYLENTSLLPSKLSERAPQWLMEHPVLLIYAVKGCGRDLGSMEFNEYFPYDNALPVIRKYHDLWNSQLMSVLMHWEGTAPWAPPYVWPPAGGVDMLKNFIDQMHADNNLVGLYCSGIGWTQQSMIDRSYDCRKEFEEKELINEVCRGPQGEAYSRVCNGAASIRLGYDLCPSRKFTIDTVCSQIAPAAEVSVDYMQYFDQNPGGSSPLCYEGKHGHSRLPDHWQTRAMQNLLERAREAAGKMVLGCENAAAEPYMDVCMLNDLRSHLAWSLKGYPVPLYSYLFHEYAAGFSGNGVHLQRWVDLNKTPFYLQWYLAWNFTNGNLLSVVLKNDGKIHWHWAMLWEVPEPDQDKLQTLIGNLCRWQQGVAKDALSRGRMIKSPDVKFSGRDFITPDDRCITLPAVTSATWLIDNRKELLLVNYNDTEETGTVTFPAPQSGIIHMADSTVEFDAETLTVTVPPLDAVLIEFK